MLIYNLTVGLPESKDVIERMLTIYVNGQLEYKNSYPPNTSDFGEFGFRHKDLVKVVLVDVDDAGNKSQPGIFEFQAFDNIAPVAPGRLGARLIREDYDS